MNEPTRGFRLRDGMTPIVLSVVVNASLFALLARSFCASSLPEARYIAVELEPSVRVTAHAPPTQKPKIVISAPAAPTPAPAVKRPQAVLAAKHEIGVPPREGSGPPREGEVPAEPRPPIAYSAPGDVGLSGGDAGSAGGSGGASSGGPGAYTGPGDGGGTPGGSGSSSGSGLPGGTVSGERHIPQPHQSPSISEGPKPAPKGESHAAQLLGQVRPAYPSDARDDGVEGTAVLSISLNTAGKVTSAKVVTSSGDGRLDRAAVEAVGKWTYSPCLKDGVPVASTVRVRVEFRLE